MPGCLAREAGDSVKPEVKRSGTPGPVIHHLQSPQSGRQSVACGRLDDTGQYALNMSDSYTNLLYHVVITSEVEPQKIYFRDEFIEFLKATGINTTNDTFDVSAVAHCAG